MITDKSPGEIFLEEMKVSTWKPRTKKQYFTPITQNAIIAFNSEDNNRLKNIIYDAYIKKAFDKLAENIIHRFKFYYFDVPYEDVKQETVSFLIEKIHKYDHTTGFKAFSYFSIVAKNYLIVRNNENYDKLKNKCDLAVVDNELGVVNAYQIKEKQEDISAFMDMYISYISRNLDVIFTKDRDKRIADSVIVLFENRANIFSYNKKALYILIREHSGSKTQYITRVVNVLKNIYYKLWQEYESTGKIQFIFEK